MWGLLLNSAQPGLCLTFRLRTVMMLPAALFSAVPSANRRSFLFILMPQSFGCRWESRRMPSITSQHRAAQGNEHMYSN